MRTYYFQILGLISFSMMMFIHPAYAQENEVFEEFLSLYKQYDVVLLGEQHWSKSESDFRISLVEYPKFADVVNDIVIEWGNYLYQDILDNYVLNLKDVSDKNLFKVWRNTTQTTGVWDLPIYEKFIRTVRKVNESLPLKKRVRIIAGDPPIDWSKVKTFKDILASGNRDEHPSKIIESQVLRKNRKALVIYGTFHFIRLPGKAGGGMVTKKSNGEIKDKKTTAPPRRNITNRLEEIIPGKVFVILPMNGLSKSPGDFQKTVGRDKVPFLEILKNSKYTGNLHKRVDGILFLGSQTETRMSMDPSIENDQDYQNEISRRRKIVEEGRS